MDRIIIIGGGISGLSLAYLLQKQRLSLDLIVLEAKERVGGKIWTDKAGGFLCESGVNGFLDNKPRTLELVSDLSLTPLRSNDLLVKYKGLYLTGNAYRGISVNDCIENSHKLATEIMAKT